MSNSNSNSFFIFGKEILISTTILCFSLILRFIILPRQIETHQVDLVALNPRFFSEKLSDGMIFLSAALFVKSVSEYFRNRHNHSLEKSGTGTKNYAIRISIAFAVTFIYAFCIQSVGYFVSTAVMMVFFMVFFGSKNWILMAANVLIVLPIVFFGFIKCLKVVFPDGIFM